MSDLETLHLKLPYLAAAQAQKHVTHNEALRRLDGIVQLAVLNSSLTDPPETPAEGDRYVVATGGTGDWAGHDGELASYVDGAWDFDTPEDGWLAFDVAAGVLLAHQASGWAAVSGVPTTVDRLGINATADDTNRLAVKSEAVLFSGIDAADGGSGDIRFVVNKEADGDTASLLFQSGWSGRAEVGLSGDTDFVFKVSPDGTTWIEAIRVDKDTGLPTLLYDNGASGLAATTLQDAIDEVAASGGGGGSASDNLAGWQNLLINPDGRFNQRSAASIADDAYGHDRWYALTQTDAITVSTLSDPEDGTPRMMRLNQDQATAQRMGYAQIIEGANCKHLRGQDVVLSGRIRCSAAQAIRYAILEWTGSEDTVTSDVVNDWTSGAYTAGNFFLGSNLTVAAVGSITPSAATLTNLAELTATLGSTFNNLIVLIWTEGTAAQNVTLDLALQFEKGAAATNREVRPYPVEEMLCKRYCRAYSSTGPIVGSTVSFAMIFDFGLPMRATPTLTHPYTDALFMGATPTAGRWGIQDFTAWATKASGTISIGVAADDRRYTLYSYGATFSRATVQLRANGLADILFTAEL